MQIKVLRKERRLKKTCAVSGKKEERQKKKTDGEIKDLDKGRVCVYWCVSAGTGSSVKPCLSPFLLIRAV